MTTEELTDYIKKKCRSGYPSGELKMDLMEKGYKETDIDAAFYALSQKDYFNKPLWYLVSILFIGLGIYQYSLANKIWGWSTFIWGCSSLLTKIIISYKEESD